MSHFESSHERRTAPGYRALAVDSPSLHHGAKRREQIIEAEVRELERRRAIHRAIEERRRILQRPAKRGSRER